MKPEPLAALLACILALGAAFVDLRSRRIPNSLTYPAILLAFGIRAVSGSYHLLLPTGAGLALGAGLILPAYLFKAMGAGDLKLMAALGAFLGPKMILTVFLNSLIAGGLIALMYLALRGELRAGLRNALTWVAGIFRRRAGYVPPGEEWVSIGKIPYGMAIAIGTVSALLPSFR
jgi:prepilin peptidase CpaA